VENCSDCEPFQPKQTKIKRFSRFTEIFIDDVVDDDSDYADQVQNHHAFQSTNKLIPLVIARI
jgi:hypothetical protein